MLKGSKNISLSLIFILVLSNFVVYAQEETATDFGDAGVTPDSALYNLELFFEGAQLALTVDPVAEAELVSGFIQERHAEMDVMHEQENYDGLEEAVDELNDNLETLEETVENIPATEENLDLIHEIEKEQIVQEDHVEEIHLDLQTKADTGEITTETLEEIQLTQTEELSVSVQGESENTQDEIIELIAEEQGITNIEAEAIVEERAEENGLTELQEEEIKEELVETEKTIEQVETQLADLKEAGTEISNEAELNQIIEEAKTELQISEDKYEHGLIGDSFEELTVAEKLILNAELAAENPADFDDSLAEGLVEEVEEVVEEREEEAADFVEEFEEAREELVEKYPDKVDDFEYDEERSQKVLDLAQKMSDTFSKNFETLKTEGKTEEEATQILTERFAQEYRLAYGEEYVPPGFKTETKINEEGKIEHELSAEIGTFVEGYKYTDPITEFKYEFTENGYKYITPLGVTYTESFPEGFELAESYETGAEVHSHIEKNPEGSIIYNYYPTGYEVILSDGTKETFSYPEGEYEILSGGEITVDATGYGFTDEGGEEHKYDYNPKFENYAAKEGTELVTFTPPEGTAIHHEEVEYIEDTNFYSYENEGEIWVYNPAAGTWSSSTGESYTPSATSVAPVGHEGDKSFTTPNGDEWTFDASSGEWSSSNTGESYNPSTHQYSSGEGKHNWGYDSSSGKWVSSTGEVHEAAHTTPGTETTVGTWTYDAGTGAWATSTGDSWSYDSGTGTWTSTTGETHAGPAPGSEEGGQVPDGGMPH